MKLLCISDLHGDLAALEKLSDEIAASDLILCAGDFTDFGGKADMLKMLGPLLPRRSSLAAVAGNCDRAEARKALEAEDLAVDGRARTFGFPAGEMTVIGAGGGLFRTGLTPYERREGELVGAFESAMHELEGRRPPSAFLIALSHHPPLDCGADFRHGSHVGSQGLRNILDSLKPVLWVCGHIHEGRSISRVEDSLVVNPGSLREGFYARGRLEPGNSAASIQMELKNL